MKRILFGILFGASMAACGDAANDQSGLDSATSPNAPVAVSQAANTTDHNSAQTVVGPSSPTTAAALSVTPQSSSFPTPRAADGVGIPYDTQAISVEQLPSGEKMPMSVDELFDLLKRDPLLAPYFDDPALVAAADVQYGRATDSSSIEGPPQSYATYVVMGGKSECPNFGLEGPPTLTCSAWAIVDADSKKVTHEGESELPS